MVAFFHFSHVSVVKKIEKTNIIDIDRLYWNQVVQLDDWDNKLYIFCCLAKYITINKIIKLHFVFFFIFKNLLFYCFFYLLYFFYFCVLMLGMEYINILKRQNFICTLLTHYHIFIIILQTSVCDFYIFSYPSVLLYSSIRTKCLFLSYHHKQKCYN